MYISMILLSAVEIPGIALTTLAVDRFSRRTVMMTTMSIGGIACLTASQLPNGFAHTKMMLAIFGKLNISGSFSLIFVYTTEIFPTVLRLSGLGLCSVFARIGGISAPYLLRLVSVLFLVNVTRIALFLIFQNILFVRF